jgi:putative transposase
MQEEIQFKKRIHLKDFDYTGYYRYFITICTLEKQAIFVNKSVVDPIIDFLKRLSNDYNFIVWAYCFMPDHLHLLLEGTDSSSNLKKFIAMFKQKTAFWYKQNYRARLWQINYYEHVLRRKEDTKEIAYYIFTNPVRAKLVDDYRDYPYSGSFEFDFKNLI